MVISIDLSTRNAGAALVDALLTDSCAFVTGHGIEPALRDEMVAVTRSFFDLPPAQKAAVRWDGEGAWKGWQPVYEGRPEITGSRQPDLLERFEAQELGSFSSWPARPEGFAHTWTAYFGACGSLASDVVELLVSALDLPRDSAETWTSRHYANLVANHYLPQSEPPAPGQVRTGAHTDRGGLTLLWADQAPGGLQVRRRGTTEWDDVLIPPDAFVVQVGDMFSRWTNGKIKANVHRVVNPPPEVASTASRLALVYFHYPNLDTLIEPAPSCITDRTLPIMDARAHFFHRQEYFKENPDYVGVS